MSGPQTYEIHVFRSGQWKIQAFFDDKELALLEARRMTESKRYPAIRVVEERWDEKAQEFNSRIVFRDSEVERQNEQVIQQRAQHRREVDEQRRQRQQRRKKPANKSKRPAWLAGDSYVLLALKGVGIAIVGMVLIYALNMLR